MAKEAKKEVKKETKKVTKKTTGKATVKTTKKEDKKETKNEVNVTNETVYVLLVVILFFTLIVGIGNYIFDKAQQVNGEKENRPEVTRQEDEPTSYTVKVDETKKAEKR